MQADDPARADERVGDLLQAYDEALALGKAPGNDLDLSLPEEVRQRLQRLQGTLDRLAQRRRPVPLMESAVALADGKLGRFEVRRELGRGGHGIVLLAYDPLLRREVALKVPRLEASLSPELRRRFLREARAAAGLNHPHLVPVHEAGESGPFCYIVSAYCRGETLAAWIRGRTSPVPVRGAAALVAALADAVHYMHDRGVLHRDIKPGNVLLEPAEPEALEGLGVTPRLADFGLAKVTSASTQETASGALLGTPAYMAPEQAAGRAREATPRSDVWALGVMLYELLTGRLPFLGEGHTVLQRVLTNEPLGPRALRPGLDPTLGAMVLKCLEKQPERRYGSAAALRDDLGRWLRGEPTRVRPPGLLGKAWRGVRQHPRKAVGMVLLVCLAFSLPVLQHVTDPNRPLRSLESKLASKQAVTLLDETGAPAWSRVQAVDGKVLTSSGNGTFWLSTTELGLLELLSDPQLENYRLRAEVQYKGGTSMCSMGVYVGHSKHVTPLGAEHGFLELSVNYDNSAPLQDASGRRIGMTTFQLRRYRPEGTAPLCNAKRTCVGHKNFPVPHEGDESQVWHSLAIEVTPGAVRAFWEGQPMGEMSRAYLNKAAGEMFRDSEGADPKLQPRDALGLYVMNGTASFRSVIVEPLVEH
jgi:serine/threonine protein kinase